MLYGQCHIDITTVVPFLHPTKVNPAKLNNPGEKWNNTTRNEKQQTNNRIKISKLTKAICNDTTRENQHYSRYTESTQLPLCLSI